eukprot:CAMPEP_0113936838 /NCGR_PEP_ID=MMETSP1339-20121228/3614_1 /TAXON_ID=94617 /ORGANISM="Fibrocapsa japonica" /LENGTH=326 /DNA_ID=CAMNT_0000939399 /DNA_START=55 /DNA_END=1035 /DNA_ORIENTATION=+ /assembly_acc=CAM_ASM_000762
MKGINVVAIVLLNTWMFSEGFVGNVPHRQQMHWKTQLIKSQDGPIKSPSSFAMSSPEGANEPNKNPVAGGIIQNESYDKIIDAMLSAEGGYEAGVAQYIDLCDQTFMDYLRQSTSAAFMKEDSARGDKLADLFAEINTAMQKRLVEADQDLREILQAAGEQNDVLAMGKACKKKMKEGRIGVPFMVILSMNIIQAKEKGAEGAANMLTHLHSVITAEQDKQVNPETRLLRLLLRTDCSNVRKQMLQEKLIFDINGTKQVVRTEEPKWGGPEVTPDQLTVSINDLLEQMEAYDESFDGGVTEQCTKLTNELNDVVDDMNVKFAEASA